MLTPTIDTLKSLVAHITLSCALGTACRGSWLNVQFHNIEHLLSAFQILVVHLVAEIIIPAVEVRQTQSDSYRHGLSRSKFNAIYDDTRLLSY